MSYFGDQGMERPSNLVHLLACLVALSIALISVQATAGQKPVIQVTFELEGDFLMSTDKRATLSTDIVSAIIKKAENYWGFIEWMPPPSSVQDQSTEKQPVWKTKLIIETQISTSGDVENKSWSGDLKHFYSIDGVDFHEIKQAEDETPIYPLGQGFVQRANTEALKTDILCYLKPRYGKILMRPDATTFIKSVPITDTVVVDSQKKAIKIPFSLQELKAKDTTKLKVEFIDDEFQKPGWISLANFSPLSEEIDGETKREIKGRVTSYLVDGEDVFDLDEVFISDKLKSPGRFWLGKFKDIGSPYTVYMEEYNCEGTTCGIDGAVADSGLRSRPQAEELNCPALGETHD